MLALNYDTYKGFERVFNRHMSTLCVDYGRFVPLPWHKARPHTPKLSTPALSLTIALSKEYCWYGDLTHSEAFWGHFKKRVENPLL